MSELIAFKINRVVSQEAFPEADPEEDDTKKKKNDYVKWSIRGERSYYPEVDYPTTTEVPAGIYEILYDNQRNTYFMRSKDVTLDELYVLPSPEQKMILSDVEGFWGKKDQFKKYGYTYKRGILLYGPAGCGKSSVINLLAKEIVSKHSGIVIYINSRGDIDAFMSFISSVFKQIEPDKQILCILEDLETFASYREDESKLLNLLDGANQMDNIVYLGTTNYPEQLKERILNRPSRFDRRYEISYPNADVRRYYFEKKYKPEDLETINLDKLVAETEGLSIAHLGEVVKSTAVLGNTIDETMELLKDMKKKLSSYDFDKDTKESIGFHSNSKKKAVKKQYENEDEEMVDNLLSFDSSGSDDGDDIAPAESPRKYY